MSGLDAAALERLNKEGAGLAQLAELAQAEQLEQEAVERLRQRAQLAESELWANHLAQLEQLSSEAALSREVARQRLRREARRRLEAEERPPAPPFDAGTLAELLERPPEPPYRVEGLVPSESGTLVVAQRKTGKTTLLLNLARCLVLGEPFLNRFEVRPVAGRIGFLNYEVSAAMLARWAAEAGVPADRLYLVNLRGRRNPLGVEEDRARLAAQLRAQEVETLIVDPFGRAYTGESQNDSGEVGAWLQQLDAFARGEVGAVDLVLSAHAGWEAERTRGASALEDWADTIVTLTRDRNDEHARYLKAEGRDVDVDEDRLAMDSETRRLSLTGTGDRKQTRAVARTQALMQAIIGIVEQQPGIKTGELETRLRELGHGMQRGEVGKVARCAVDGGMLRSEQGPRNAVLYYPDPAAEGRAVPVVPSAPEYRSGVVPSPPYMGGTTHRTAGERVVPDSLGGPTPEQAELLERITGGAA